MDRYSIVSEGAIVKKIYYRIERILSRLFSATQSPPKIYYRIESFFLALYLITLVLPGRSTIELKDTFPITNMARKAVLKIYYRIERDYSRLRYCPRSCRRSTIELKEDICRDNGRHYSSAKKIYYRIERHQQQPLSC